MDIATLGIKIDSSDGKTAAIVLDRLADSGGKAEASAKSATSAFNSLKTVLASLGIATTLAELGQLADTFKNIEGRLSLVTTGTAELAQVTDKLFEVSQRSRVGFEATSDLYASLARSTKTLGTTQKDLLAVTETINKALIVSGASAATAQGALTQLGQGFASGTLRGDELNSVLEGTPRLAQAIADGMGVTVGQLRALGAQGKITGETVFDALKSQGDAVEKEFSKMPLTISQSFTQLKNEVLKYVGETDSASGASAAFASAIQKVGDNLDTVVKVVEVLITAVGIRLTASFVASTAAAVVEEAALVGLTATTDVLAFAVTSLATKLAALSIVGGVALAFVAFANDTLQANAAIDQANKSFDEMQKKGGAAQTHVVGLGEDALGSIPKIDSFGGKVGEAAQKLYDMARAARAARVEMLQTQLTESQKNEKALANATPSGQDAVAGQNRQALAKGDILGIDTSVVTNRARSLLSGGRTDREATAAYSKQVAVSMDLQEKLKQAQTDPITPADAPIVTHAPAAAKKKTEAKSDEEKAYDSQIKKSQDYSRSLKEETLEIGKNQIQTKELQSARAQAEVIAAGARLGTDAAIAKSKQLASTIAEETKAWKEKTIGQAATDLVTNIKDENAQLQFEASLIGKNAKEIEILNAQHDIENKLLAIKKSLGVEAYEKAAAAVKEEADAHIALAAAKGQSKLDVDNAKEYTAAMNDLNATLRDAVSGFGDLFGTAGQGFENLINVVADYGDKVASIQQRIAEATANGNEEERQRATEQLGRASVKHYGDMLGAAKTFFAQGSTGYRVLEAAEKAYRLYQMIGFAMEIANKTRAIAVDTAHTASSVANSGARATADGIAGVAKAIASLPFPLNLVAGAATLAALVAIGVQMVGGGGGASSSAGTTDTSSTTSSGAGDSTSMTSPYSTLPGQGGLYDPTNASGNGTSTLASSNDNSYASNNTASGSGSTFVYSPVIHADNADAGTVQQIQDMLDAQKAETVAIAREYAAQDRVAAATRQRIGNG